ncbi:hypothetical protein [Roseofilum casamattae]|nr:hypothetical protein [Roseofilum casamattae]
MIGSSQEQKNAIALIERNLKDGWSTEPEMATQTTSRFLPRGGKKYIVFSCSANTSRRAATLWLIPDENDYLYVCNIVPSKGGHLSEDEYNVILEEFLTKFVEPAALELNIQVITTPSERTIDNAMSPEMSELLKRFSDGANKSSGGTHPYDERRFFNFIIQAHQEKSLLDETKLCGLLMEDDWSEEDARELSSKYCFSRDLLNHYERSLA